MKLGRTSTILMISLTTVFLTMNPTFSAEDDGIVSSITKRSTPEKVLVRFSDLDVDRPQINGYVREADRNNPVTASSGGAFLAVLPVCKIDKSLPCINEVAIKSLSEKKWEILQVAGYVPQEKSASSSTFSDGITKTNLTSTWEGDEKRLLPSSDKAQIYFSSKHPHKGGGQYVLKARIDGVSSATTPDVFSPIKMALTVIPIKGVNYPGTGAFSSTTYQFPDDIEFRISVNLGNFYNVLSGWFYGRTVNTLIDMNSLTKNITISAQPAAVPIHTGYIPFPLPTNLESIFSKTFQERFSKSKNPAVMAYSSSDINSINIWKKFEPYLEKSSDFERTIWSITSTTNSVRYPATKPAQDCIGKNSGLGGLVTSNAAVFSQGSPSWNESEGSLSYQVASPSLNSKGKTNLGNYRIALRADVAQCLWGTTLENAKVEISVVGESSDFRQVATTSFKSENGWVYFSASGFHYSSPVIKVTIKKEAPVNVITPTPSAKPKPSPAKITMTCVKGKMVKKVIGIDPKCPLGYKKKT